MTPERIEELRNKIGLDPDEACEVLDRVAELEATARQREDLIQDNRERLQVLKARVAELEAQHPEWMKRIQREREDERERCRAAICDYLDTHEVDHLEGPELDHTIRVVLDA